MTKTEYLTNGWRRGSHSTVGATRRDLLAAIWAWPLWTMLGWNDIRQRYRRSVLGPFWITLSMAIFIALLGVIYSNIFKIEIRTYLPFLTLGYIVWGFISQTTNESSIAFQEGERIIRQIRLPYAVFVLRVVWRNFIVFLHTIVIFIPIAVIFDVRPGYVGLLALPGLALVYINQVWVTLTLAILCTRYRDVQQIVTTAVQIMLFVTPIMWPITALGSAVMIAYANPLYHIIDLVRAPMLGHAPSHLSWLVAITSAVVGWTIAILLLRRASRRLVFWL
jgi:lipopolysaccharide transport system permease protein